jgi:hypothetical protein
MSTSAQRKPQSPPLHSVSTSGPSSAPIVRTASGLREALFNEMDRVIAGTSTPAQARSIALLANSIIDSVAMEVEVARMRNLLSGGAHAVQDEIGAMKLVDHTP